MKTSKEITGKVKAGNSQNTKGYSSFYEWFEDVMFWEFSKNSSTIGRGNT
jgi:hypothetical protein